MCRHVSCILVSGLQAEKTEVGCHMKVNAMVTALITSTQILMHLYWANIEACSAAAGEPHVWPKISITILSHLHWAERRSQPLLLLLLIWQPQKTASPSMVKKNPKTNPRYRTVQFTVSRCAKSMSNSCPSLFKSLKSDPPTPDLVCSDTPPAHGHFAKWLTGAKVRSRRLGQYARCAFGAWHHNIFTADCCFNGHSTKFASFDPPLRPVSIGKEKGWVTLWRAFIGWQLGQSKSDSARPPGAFDEWAGLRSQLDSPHGTPHTYLTAWVEFYLSDPPAGCQFQTASPYSRTSALTTVTHRFVHLQLPAIYSRLRDISQDREH